MKDEEIRQAKEVLRNAGYFVENLWHIDDVDLDGTDDDKMQILDDVLCSSHITTMIFESISDSKDYYYFKKMKA
jgi:hypothetical protein